MLPLQGIRVVSIEHAVAAPFASRQLADLGAEIIKIEKPGVGDFARSYDEATHGLSGNFVWLNRGKKSVELDLKKQENVQLIFDILQDTDVLLNNLGPGALDRLGFNPEKLHEIFPHLIICSISGYGKEGPYSNKKAYDLLIQSEAAVLQITGSPDAPAKTGLAVVDIASGMYAFSSILAAIIHRNKTKIGTIIEISMLEAIAEWMSFPIYYTYGGTEPVRSGTDHATIYPYGPFLTMNKEQLFIAIQNNREWEIFCREILKDASLIVNPRFKTNILRVQNKMLLKKIIEDVTGEIDRADLANLLDEKKIANAYFNDINGLINHPQLQFYQKWKNVNSEVGKISMLQSPMNFNNISCHWGDIPLLGEHTDEVLSPYKKRRSNY
ncbi:TPA: CoA transferase [Salmonella enterica subsp. enterica serovar Typhi str. AG3]|nr:CoA transferase [Salmonella enterica subsp. enterica serovar Typhi str. AG3]